MEYKKYGHIAGPKVNSKTTTIVVIAALAFFPTLTSGQGPDQLSVNADGKGNILEINFLKGKSHNHPLMAVWAEDTAGNYIQTIYVAQSVATGIFKFADKSSGQWTSGELIRPASLPYWAHKRGIQSEIGQFMPTPSKPLPDAYTGPTPKNDFTLYAKMDTAMKQKFNILLEINQPWDWNEYWTNTKFMDDYEYRTSSQPALVYMATVDPSQKNMDAELKIIGHSHYSGKDGNLYEDISTLTTALNIAKKITVKVIE